MTEVARLYTKPGCPHCFNARRDFDARGVEYVEFNVREDADARDEMLEINGGVRRVPTIVEGESVTIGFNGGY
jgi:glutaredoxin 3